MSDKLLLVGGGVGTAPMLYKYNDGEVGKGLCKMSVLHLDLNV